MSPLRLLLADDHTLVRAGFRALLSGIPDMQVVGEASDGHDALRLIEQLDPDIALMDISMPGLNGLEATARATRERWRTRIVILSMHADEEYVRKALTSGAAGYLLKNASEGELHLAIRAVARGDNWLSPGVSKPVFAAYAHDPEMGRGTIDALTPRQREVLQLIAEGQSTKEIAQRLALSVKTVETHRAKMMERLGILTAHRLVTYAIRACATSHDP
jgi:DNA-binding NarL/FixJ family response regulator